MKGKGQVLSGMLILALVFAAVVGLTAYLAASLAREQARSAVPQTYERPLTMIRAFVTLAVRDNVDTYIEEVLAPQAGYADVLAAGIPLEVVGTGHVPVVYDLGEGHLPSLEFIEGEIEAQVRGLLLGLDLSHFDGSDVRLVLPEPEDVWVDADARPKGTTLVIHYPLLIYPLPAGASALAGLATAGKSEGTVLEDIVVETPYKYQYLLDFLTCVETALDKTGPGIQGACNMCNAEFQEKVGTDESFGCNITKKNRLINVVRISGWTGDKEVLQTVTYRTCSGNYDPLLSRAQRRICDFACTYEIPEALALAIASLESGFEHTEADGSVSISQDGGVGMFQITDSSLPPEDVQSGEATPSCGPSISTAEVLNPRNLLGNIECGIQEIKEKCSLLAGPTCGEGEKRYCCPQNHLCCTDPGHLCCRDPGNICCRGDRSHACCNPSSSMEKECCDSPSGASLANCEINCPECLEPVGSPMRLPTRDIDYSGFDISIRGYNGWGCVPGLSSMQTVAWAVGIQSYVENVHALAATTFEDGLTFDGACHSTESVPWIPSNYEKVDCAYIETYYVEEEGYPLGYPTGVTLNDYEGCRPN